MLAIPTSNLSTFFSLKRVCQTLKTILFYGRDILNVDSSSYAALQTRLLHLYTQVRLLYLVEIRQIISQSKHAATTTHIDPPLFTHVLPMKHNKVVDDPMTVSIERYSERVCAHSSKYWTEQIKTKIVACGVLSVSLLSPFR